MGTKNILRIPNITRKKLHPTEKPVELFDVLISNSSSENEVVLDPFMGVGGAGISAKNLDRDFIGIELDNEYFQIAKDRIEQAQKYPGTEYKKPTDSTNKKLF